MGIKFVPYESENGWRWRLVSGNNKIMGGSEEAYDSLGNLNRALNTLEQGLTRNLVADEGLMVIRKEHWEAAKEWLQDQSPSTEEISRFFELVENAAI